MYVIRFPKRCPSSIVHRPLRKQSTNQVQLPVSSLTTAQRYHPNTLQLLATAPRTCPLSTAPQRNRTTCVCVCVPYESGKRSESTGRIARATHTPLFGTSPAYINPISHLLQLRYHIPALAAAHAPRYSARGPPRAKRCTDCATILPAICIPARIAVSRRDKSSEMPFYNRFNRDAFCVVTTSPKQIYKPNAPHYHTGTTEKQNKKLFMKGGKRSAVILMTLPTLRQKN